MWLMSGLNQVTHGKQEGAQATGILAHFPLESGKEAS